jgi:hypothetical protein
VTLTLQPKKVCIMYNDTRIGGTIGQIASAVNRAALTLKSRSHKREVSLHRSQIQAQIADALFLLAKELNELNNDATLPD